MVPYTDSTLIIDLVDGQTNQLVWRGFNTDTINLKKPEHDFKDAVNDGSPDTLSGRISRGAAPHGGSKASTDTHTR